ncbi:Protein GLUTAMINE DUMPER 4 [Camellia lanceoleosa]|uniref:Protein GLUTAMINE DUMPER 4 n=1 Tax=Camellia lanceoleosa TaxID=1840588 RepID=A0ACC0F9D8_9ERIC|nr:Protein GLUTAMINE DUMPER 4 [Camellia lanceoleosa]
MGWNSAVEFVFYGLAVLLGFVIVTLITFSCSKLINMPNSSTSHHHNTEKPKQAMNTSMAIHVEPQIVVIMAGDAKPTYLATPVLPPIQHSHEQV